MYRSPAERDDAAASGALALPAFCRPIDVREARRRQWLRYLRITPPVLALVCLFAGLPHGLVAALALLNVSIVIVVVDRLELRRWTGSFRRGQELFKQGRRDDARRVFERLAAETRRSPHWHAMVVAQYAAVLATARDAERALLLTEAIEASGWLELRVRRVPFGGDRVPFERLRPWVAALLATRAVCHLQSGHRDEAERALVRAEAFQLPPGLSGSLLLPRAVLAGLEGRDRQVVEILAQIPDDPPDYGRQLGIIRAFALDRLGEAGAAAGAPKLASPASAYWVFAAWPELEEWASTHGLVAGSAG
jgi:hypothetical protein